MSTIVIVGASGVVGSATLDRFALKDGEWDVVAVSRRPPEITAAGWRHLAIDLRNRAESTAVLGGLTDVTHVVYTALFEKPGLVAGWRDRDQMETNLTMLRNTLDPIIAASPGLRHVTLLQGTKAYGIHLHAIPIPARESSPRDPHDNFYWLQEDYVREKAAEHDFAWTIFRPQLVVGGVVGVAMNLAPVIGTYAAICQEEGLPFGYPGGPSWVWEAVDARICASAIDWAIESPAAANETFNITNGDVFEWRNLWPALADALGAPLGADAPREMASFLPAHEASWARVAAKHGLRSIPLRDLLGESHYYADRCFAYGLTAQPDPRFVSTIKLRQAGFAECIDTEVTFRHWLSVLQERRYLPPPA